MKEERCVLPVKCKSCEGVFDLWYDLQTQEQLRKRTAGQSLVYLSGNIGRLVEQQALCWECRKKAVLGGPIKEENELDDVELEEYDLISEY
jgi:hypothetical protein